jgi:rfaE bifunctional protein kinase chain/domain
MMDYYYQGHISKMSQEAPIPVWVQDSLETRDGGAANVVKNLEALGCQVTSVFPQHLQWSVKFRYFVGNHQMFRVDRDQISNPPDISTIPDIAGFDVVCLSDYAKGFLSEEVCQHVIKEGNRLGVPVIVDPKGASWAKYAGCYLITPNLKESIERKCSTEFANVLLKNGSAGMTLWSDKKFTEIAAQKVEVVCVNGAGDTVIAIMAACIGTKSIDLVNAARIANFGAGLSVTHLGTYALTADELLRCVR